MSPTAAASTHRAQETPAGRCGHRLLLGAPRRRMATRTGQAYQNQKAPTPCQKHFQAGVGYYQRGLV